MISLRLKAFPPLVFLALCSFLTIGAATLSSGPAGKLLPNKLGNFRAAGPIEPITPELIEPRLERNGVSSWAKRTYDSAEGARFSVVLITAGTDSGAYALFSEARRKAETFGRGTGDAEVGTAGFSLWDGTHNTLSFCKGQIFAIVSEEAKSNGVQPLTEFARTLADTLDRGEGEIPVLIKHLPNWKAASRNALYVVSVETLREKFGPASVFSAVDFKGAAEAVVANYENAEMVIVEFNTPQLATENDGLLNAKLQELRSQGQPLPTAYRRVGNYSVFVFNASSPEAANRLIDGVKYEQMVQWLGENPYLYERALRQFSETTLGVFVNVVKGSGLALLSCLAVGGLFGGLLFMRRRAQQREAEAYSDSGAMLRLNLDELTSEVDSPRLLGPGK